MISTIVEFVAFLMRRKKYWLVPVMVVSVVFGSLLVLSHGSVVAPFIYTLF
jgi:hypothetical protein